MKSPYLGAKGHIAVGTNSVDRAVNYLESQGVEFNMDSAKYKDGKLTAIYLKRKKLPDCSTSCTEIKNY